MRTTFCDYYYCEPTSTSTTDRISNTQYILLHDIIAWLIEILCIWVLGCIFAEICQNVKANQKYMKSQSDFYIFKFIYNTFQFPVSSFQCETENCTNGNKLLSIAIRLKFNSWFFKIGTIYMRKLLPSLQRYKYYNHLFKNIHFESYRNRWILDKEW